MAGSIAAMKNAAKGAETTGEAQPKPEPKKRTPGKKPPGKAVAKAAPAKVDKGDFTPAKAKAHVEKIKKAANSTVDLLHEAWQGRIWLASGLKSWDAWIDQEFKDGFPLALPREKRKPTVQNLSERGWSTRAIAAVTGTSQKTADRDVREGLSQNDSVATDDNIIDAEVVDTPESEEPRTVTGLDGKERAGATATSQQEPALVNIVSAAKNLKKKLEAVTFELGELYDRDDYEENQIAVDKVLQQPFDDFVEQVTPDRLGFDVTEDAPTEAEPELVPSG